MDKTVVLRAAQCEVVEAEWGRLVWYAGRKLGIRSLWPRR